MKGIIIGGEEVSEPRKQVTEKIIYIETKIINNYNRNVAKKKDEI